MNDRIRNNIEETLDAIVDTPDEYKKIAFEVVLGYLLSSTKNTPIHERRKDIFKGKHEGGIDTILNSNFDWTSTNIPLLKPSLQNLYILKIAKEKFGIDSLSPNEIQSILTQKFRISKTPNAVSMSLMNEIGKHIDRIQKGKEFLYWITENGIRYLNQEIEKMENK